jgi:hypothetical protein
VGGFRSIPVALDFGAMGCWVLAAVVLVALGAVFSECWRRYNGQTHTDNSGHAPLPTMSFPRFSGEHPWVWRDKCHDYFRAFNISPVLWITTATLHMG